VEADGCNIRRRQRVAAWRHFWIPSCSVRPASALSRPSRDYRRNRSN
jgi:hypothetical protein